MSRFAERLRLATLALLLSGCTSAGGVGDAAAADAVFRRAPARWADVARELAAARVALDAALLRRPHGDLAAVADRADRAAAAVRLGYGPLEDRGIPRFAQRARQTESWLLQVALEARQGHGALAAERYRSGREQHCSGCHDACGRSRG